VWAAGGTAAGPPGRAQLSVTPTGTGTGWGGKQYWHGDYL